MPDRDIFDSCSSKAWNTAFSSIFRDRTDPNAVLNTVCALKQYLVGLDSALIALADWVVNQCEPLRLFVSRTVDPAVDAIPIELRTIVERATRQAAIDLMEDGRIPSRVTGLSHILAYISVQRAADSCAIEVARRKLGLTNGDVRLRLHDLEAQLILSSDLRSLAERILRGESGAREVSRRRRQKTATVNLLNVPLVR